MTVRRRFRRNSLKDFFETVYKGTRRFSKEYLIRKQSIDHQTLEYTEKGKHLIVCVCEIFLKF